MRNCEAVLLKIDHSATVFKYSGNTMVFRFDRIFRNTMSIHSYKNVGMKWRQCPLFLFACYRGSISLVSMANMTIISYTVIKIKEKRSLLCLLKKANIYDGVLDKNGGDSEIIFIIIKSFEKC